MKELDIAILLEDINPIIKRGMEGVVLEVYGDDTAYEVEFLKDNGINYEYDNNITFTIEANKLKLKDK